MGDAGIDSRFPVIKQHKNKNGKKAPLQGLDTFVDFLFTKARSYNLLGFKLQRHVKPRGP